MSTVIPHTGSIDVLALITTQAPFTHEQPPSAETLHTIESPPDAEKKGLGERREPLNLLFNTLKLLMDTYCFLVYRAGRVEIGSALLRGERNAMERERREKNRAFSRKWGVNGLYFA